jgi:protein translocase SEC61 complex gamma subunit
MRIKEALERHWRVLRVMRKPSLRRFMYLARVCALGMLAIGLVGFFVYLIFVLLGV